MFQGCSFVSVLPEIRGQVFRECRFGSALADRYQTPVVEEVNLYLSHTSAFLNYRLQRGSRKSPRQRLKLGLGRLIDISIINRCRIL